MDCNWRMALHTHVNNESGCIFNTPPVQNMLHWLCTCTFSFWTFPLKIRISSFLVFYTLQNTGQTRTALLPTDMTLERNVIWSLQFISRSSSTVRSRKVKRTVNFYMRTKCCRNVMKLISREHSHAIQLNGLTLGNWMIWIFVYARSILIVLNDRFTHVATLNETFIGILCVVGIWFIRYKPLAFLWQWP